MLAALYCLERDVRHAFSVAWSLYKLQLAWQSRRISQARRSPTPRRTPDYGQSFPHADATARCEQWERCETARPTRSTRLRCSIQRWWYLTSLPTSPDAPAMSPLISAHALAPSCWPHIPRRIPFQSGAAARMRTQRRHRRRKEWHDKALAGNLRLHSASEQASLGMETAAVHHVGPSRDRLKVPLPKAKTDPVHLLELVLPMRLVGRPNEAETCRDSAGQRVMPYAHRLARHESSLNVKMSKQM
jgi:hypothetical protein